jgi:hypothetical protein
MTKAWGLDVAMDELRKIDRREAIKWVLAAGATVSLLEAKSFGSARTAKVIGTDPNLMEVYKAGDLWPLSFTSQQRRTAAALCDVIIPADERSPNASRLGVHDFIDEWISAPYPKQQADRKVVLGGLSWLDAQSSKRFKKSFVELDEESRRQICDDICYLPKAAGKFKEPALFFAKFRNLTTGGFYTTPEGMKDIQYVGNVPLTKFDGPPPEVLAHLKLT